MALWLVPLLPLLGAALPPLFIRSGRNACAAAAGLVSLVALALLGSGAGAALAGGAERVTLAWAPRIGLSFSFRLDGLALVFAALILAMGLIVIVYARFYLRRDDPMGRFYAYLLLFQGAMLGIVLADNVVLLLVFWELTSLTSFLLIGYWRQRAEARQGALTALIVTGGGGLALVGGLLLLAEAAGTAEISEIVARGDAVRASPLYLPALLMILAGAFTKSAQVPFHFWLPQAMAAPTPVSAYLHSATMVKAGIFLLARLWPALAGTEAWFLIVAPVGLATMLIGAWIALFKDDLKALLAYSTVSHLGLVTMLIGFGTPMAAVAAMFHVLNHAAFKAALFMSAGIVEHETGTRDMRRLGGLARLMPITAALAFIASAGMAGVPLFNGFLSKEMMLEEAARTAYPGLPWLFPAAATLAALVSVAYSARLAVSTFLGARRHGAAGRPHDPPAGLWLPVAVLAAPVIAVGVMPEAVAGRIVALAAGATVGGPLPDHRLALWHGATPALALSLAAFAGGAALLLAYRPADALRRALPRPQAQALFQAAMNLGVRAARGATGRLHHGALAGYLRIGLVTFVLMGLYAVHGLPRPEATRAMLPVSAPALAAWLALAGASLAAAMRHHDRLLALVLTSVAGLVVALAFVQFSAPDLALTQIAVDVVATVLMLLALNLLPKASPAEERPWQRRRDGAIAIAAGCGVAWLAYAVMMREGASIAGYYLAEAKPKGGGTNVVNVILVDFRGFDTFAEIIVLGIAALAIVALLDVRLTGAALRRLRGLMPREESGDAHPLILVVSARILLPLALAAGAYIFLRGHNQPGGGFIAGLVVAIALILQYVASGYVWADARRRMAPEAMIGAGVGLAGITGLVPLLLGRPFLTSAFGHVALPVVGSVELASAMMFDLGVFLTVVGVVLLSLGRLSRIAQRIDPVPGERAMDAPLEPADDARAGRA